MRKKGDNCEEQGKSRGKAYTLGKLLCHNGKKRNYKTELHFGKAAISKSPHTWGEKFDH